MGRKLMLAAVIAPLAIAVGIGMGVAIAADHAESPGADADAPADLADVFVFRSPENPQRMVGSITFGGRPLPRSRIDQQFYCDPRALYILNIERASATGTFTSIPTTQIFVRFAPSTTTAGRCAVQLENVPGSGGTFSGPNETVFTSSTGLKAFAGLRNDPFFFDAEGYNGMVAAFAAPPPAGGYVVSSFGLGSRPRRDSFANRNVSAVVFEMDIEALAPAGAGGVRPKVRFWSTTARRVG